IIVACGNAAGTSMQSQRLAEGQFHPVVFGRRPWNPAGKGIEGMSNRYPQNCTNAPERRSIDQNESAYLL
ncbi:hypothetical protein C2E31_08895, partial [Rhodopirellula baltica]